MCRNQLVLQANSFELGLSQTESLDAESSWRLALDIPAEWYEGDRDSLKQLVEKLCAAESLGI